jgi:hypothetical protein
MGGFDFAVGSLPGVREIAPIVGLNLLPLTAAGKPDEASMLLVPLDGRFGHLLERPKLLDGRPPASNRRCAEQRAAHRGALSHHARGRHRGDRRFHRAG